MQVRVYVGESQLRLPVEGSRLGGVTVVFVCAERSQQQFAGDRPLPTLGGPLEGGGDVAAVAMKRGPDVNGSAERTAALGREAVKMGEKSRADLVRLAAVVEAGLRVGLDGLELTEPGSVVGTLANEERLVEVLPRT